MNKKYALTFGKYKYCAIDKYKYLDVIKYLRIYEQYSQAEYLVKLNLSQFATNKAILKEIGKKRILENGLLKTKSI